MKLLWLSCIVAAPALFLMGGCVHGKNYRFNIPVEEVPCSPAVAGSCPSPAASSATPEEQSRMASQPKNAGNQQWSDWPSAADQLNPGPPCNVESAIDFHHPCLAYIEFDDLGELRDRQDQTAGSSVQVNRAVATIKAAMTDGVRDHQNHSLANVRSQPIVLVFVHGWKHNASPGPPEDTNVQGVKEFLDMLRQHYPDVWVSPDLKTQCDTQTNTCTTRLLHPVVGVYIAWRGNSIAESFVVAQQFTYFDREKTAYRVGNTSLTYTLTRISETAHPQGSASDPTQPYLLMVGHSFGGLVLERSLAQSLMTRMNSGGADGKDKSFADLIVYVNTAGAASDSKQVLDFMAENQVTNPATKKNASGQSIPDPKGKRYPEIISLSSTADQATSSVLPIGHALPLLGMKLAGSVRNPDPMVCYEPEAENHAITINGVDLPPRREISDFSSGDFYLHSAPHFQPMQSHEVLAISVADNQDVKEPAADVCHDPINYVQIDNLVFQGLNPPKEFQTLRFTDETAKDSFGPTPVMGGKCYVIVPKDIELANRPRCNGTSYFVMEVPPEIIPDHTTIFTQRLYQFLSVFLILAEDTASTPSAPQKGVLTRSAFQSLK
jgi:hypothetical protein